MKTIRSFFILLTVFTLANLGIAQAQTAQIQIIHNSADVLSQNVDIYVNDEMFIDNFEFRTATRFIEVPALVDLNLKVVPETNDIQQELMWEQTVNLKGGESYIIVANGLLSENRYEPFQPFTIYPFTGARSEAASSDNTDVLVFHGSTDAPTVDVYESGVGAGEIIDNLSYGEFAGYLSLPTEDYRLQVRDESGSDVVAEYEAPLRSLGLEGSALTVVASGFLSPNENVFEPSFGLYVALSTGGDLIPLPAYEEENQNTARLQVIHNSADAAAAVVDVWLNDTKLLENFAFRTATPFIDAPAGELLNIGIAPPNSTSWTQSFSIKQVSLTEDQTYIAVANGITSSSGYDPSPAFELNVYPIGREEASQSGNTDVLIAHGSTDAPAVDIYETGIGAGLVADDLVYSNVAGYLELETLDYIIEIRDETGTSTVAAYEAPLAALGLDGAAITVVASGFLNPDNNSNGPAFGLWVALADGGELVELQVYTPAARVQVIHNSADAAAEVVDVWLDDMLLLDDFTFRTASPFVDAPAGTPFTVAIKGPDSQNPDDPIWSMDYTLEDGKTYILVAEGIVSASGYDPATPFDIAVYDMGREAANMMDMTDVLVHHGSTDAPTVDVYETGVGAGEIVNDLMYADFAGYLELGTLDYVLEIRDESGMNTVAAYEAPLATLGLEGAAITVVASGFLNPSNNSNGPAFGLWVALADGGDLVELPVYTPTARVQVIHNSADAAAEVVDVWLDDMLLLDDFTFRTASPFVDAPAGTPFTVAIKGPDSQNPDDPIWSMDYTLEDGKTYILVAEGIVSASGYDPATPFDIAVYDMGREAANMMDMTDVLVHHGSTDAPTVDVYETGVGAGEIVNDLMYADFAGYLELGTLDYVLEIRDESGMNTVAAYEAPLATLGLEGAAITVVASGFLNPANNSNGPAFGLWVALADGGELVELPVYTAPTARVQVIHNSADAAAEVVDVWLDDMILIDDFAFRTASPFIDAPAEMPFTIAVKGPDSQDPNNPIWSMEYTLEDGKTYILVAEGIVSGSGYDPATPFDIAVYDMGREAASMLDNVDVLVHHGSTDAPTVDIYEVGVGAGEIVDNLMYGDFAGYLELAAADYSLQIRDETGETTVATFAAPLADLGLQGQAITVVASGFLNPDNNSNGPAFGLYVALASGGQLVMLTNTSSIEDIIDVESLSVFPNPVSDRVNVNFNVKESDNVRIELINLLGSKMISDDLGFLNGNSYRHTMNVNSLPEGLYIISINAGESVVTRKIQIVR